MTMTLRTPTNGRELQAARALLGWTQDELAHAAGLHVKSVSYWERKTGSRIGGHAVREMAEAFERQGLIFIDGGIIIVRPFAPGPSPADDFKRP